MSRPVGRHRARRNTGIGALRRPAVAATAAISTVSVAAAAYSTAATASATVVGTAQAKLLLAAPAATSTALRAADSGVAADGRAQLAAAQHAVSARRAADARSRAATAARAAAAAKLQRAAAQRAAEVKAAAKKSAATKAAAQRATTSTVSRDSTRPPAASFAGSPQAYASSMLSSYGWDQGQMSCLVSLWTRESGWRSSATNASSGAYGIPQSLPGSKMASAGADWRTNPATQIRWGLGYIKSTYGSPCGAWGHSQATGWY